MFEISGLHHVSLIVKNTERALMFYRDLLGLQLIDSRPDLGYPGAWLDLGAGQQIHLLELENPDPVAGRPEHGGRDRHTAFQVKSLKSLIKKLEENEISYTTSKSGRAALFCRDLDGNALEFIEKST